MTTSGEPAPRAEREYADPWQAVTDAQAERAWDVADAIVARLVRYGWLCGWPDEGDACAVVRALILSGVLKPLPIPEATDGLS